MTNDLNEKIKKLRDSPPSPLPNPDFASLIKICESYVYDLSKDGYVNEGIFENWINKVEQ